MLSVVTIIHSFSCCLADTWWMHAGSPPSKKVQLSWGVVKSPAFCFILILLLIISIIDSNLCRGWFRLQHSLSSSLQKCSAYSCLENRPSLEAQWHSEVMFHPVGSYGNLVRLVKRSWRRENSMKWFVLDFEATSFRKKCRIQVWPYAMNDKELFLCCWVCLVFSRGFYLVASKFYCWGWKSWTLNHHEIYHFL